MLCASAVETDNFVTEVGTNLYTVGANLAQYLIDTVGADGNFLMMTGIPGVTTSVIMEEGALAVFESNGIELLDNQPGFWSPAEGKKIMETWLAQHGDEIDGIWTGGAQMAQGIISAYEDAGMESRRSPAAKCRMASCVRLWITASNSTPGCTPTR